MRMNFDSLAENMQEFGKVSVVPIAHKYKIVLCFLEFNVFSRR